LRTLRTLDLYYIGNESLPQAHTQVCNEHNKDASLMLCAASQMLSVKCAHVVAGNLKTGGNIKSCSISWRTATWIHPPKIRRL